VLNFDISSGVVEYRSANLVIDYIISNKLKLEWILETHIHADHITASNYIKNKLGGKIGIGANIIAVLDYWVPILNISQDTPKDGSQFDILLKDEDVLSLGASNIKVIFTPGHTPSCVSYLIDSAIFVGDTIFMPDIGTARTDFPGGSSAILYQSIHKLFSLDDSVQIFVGHDYPPVGREVESNVTVSAQKHQNILVHEGISQMEYVESRTKRDHNKPVPKLLYPALQVNLRAGKFGDAESNGARYIKIPLHLS
jgi:glyoxylase-like metal-dependent hydrolase (beta-lactamase superfamily II)